MSDERMSDEGSDADSAGLVARQCLAGHLYYPDRAVCPDCGADESDPVALDGTTGTVITWTTARATPPGVRAPNTLAIVEFEFEGTTVRALGQTTTEDVAIGDEVRPVRVDELRDPEAAFRETDSQRWDGVRFEPFEKSN